MDGGGDAFAAAANPWSLVRGYFSPATLFLLLNMVIGTIALTSRSRRHQLDEDHRYQQHCGDRHQHAPPPPPAPLARTSSVMERLRSLGLYRFRSGDFPPEYNHHLSAGADDDSTSGGAREAQAQYARSRSEPAARLPAAARRATNNKNLEAEAVVVGAAKTKSSSEVRKLERAPAQAQTQVRRAPRAPARRAQLVVREEEDAAAAVSVDARAEDFINKFRQQLQLQRLNSLLNYREMLNRGL
ncbi:pathogen-associated molecular patterns-induced protein A70-like [Panicum virgatum]|uniref:DUF4408 domain-containing protein n=1 Tax=Panicum virgatum TaxID=38727 RepID=A0A8T0SNK3_PANVG|nr:pathogen-associated molecular patterns-induced protein A70-like [Panicum virgatum]KAG2600200.1 hypothetical protein PVAP13_5KG479007 [Panicum virgatum]